MAVIHPFADGIVDYWRKQYRFGPADVYRAKQNGKKDCDIIKELLNPMWYFNSEPWTLPVYVIGSIFQSASRIKALWESR
jgi:hypothetical protein